MERAQAQRSITLAADIGKFVQASPAWTDGLTQKQDFYSKLDATEDDVTDLMGAVLKQPPNNIEECVEHAALPEQSFGAMRKRLLANKSSTPDTLPASSSSQPHPREMTDVQTGWGYLLRQLRQAGKQHVQWRLHDTSKSGITGHSGKVSYCFSAASMKAWPQVVALAELKTSLHTESLYTECIGQLSARCEDLFFHQPLRKFMIVVAGGAAELEVLAFFRNYTLLRSGVLPLSFDVESEGLRWLCKVVLSSFHALGFTPDLRPLTQNTPQGWCGLLVKHDMVALVVSPRALVVVQAFLLMTLYV